MWQGKPHLEQDQIGPYVTSVTPCCSYGGSGRLLEALGDQGPRWMTVLDRTRLIGWHFFTQNIYPLNKLLNPATLRNMESHFLPHNCHQRSVKDFALSDPHLFRMAEQPYVFHSSLIKELPTDIPGIYNLGGGRQVGKTTLLKQWMLSLLENGVAPEAIAFLSCELIVDERSLYRIVTNQLEDMPSGNMRYLILDEITDVSNWDKAIKYLADLNAFHDVAVIISGSDLTMMQAARKRFPGRRGHATQVDFHYYPLSFRETVELKHQINLQSPSQKDISQLFQAFENYLIHGGFLTAINEFSRTQSISGRTLATYSDWIRGDIIKQGRKAHFLQELIRAIVKHYGSQVSWRNLASAMSIDHPQIAIDYTALLESMDAAFVQQAIIEDKLIGAPKKHRKIMFCDPFIFHAMTDWLRPAPNAFEETIKPTLADAKRCSAIVESVVVTHFRRYYPTYYVKANQEVDIAYVQDDRFWPIEIQWRERLGQADLSQILKYPNGQVWYKGQQSRSIQNMPALPLPLALLGI